MRQYLRRFGISGLALLLMIGWSVAGMAEPREEKPGYESKPGVVHPDAIDSNTTHDVRHDIKGFFVQLGPQGGLEVGEDRQFDVGPGARAALGHIWGLLGLRGGFSFLNMDRARMPGDAVDAELFGFDLDLMIFPMHQSTFFMQPYFVVGPGYTHLRSDELGIEDHGFTGDIGMGANFHVAEHWALALETNIRPGIYAQRGPSDDTEDRYFYSFAGMVSYFF